MLKTTDCKSTFSLYVNRTLTPTVGISTHVVVNQDASSCSYGKSKQNGKHPEHTHDDNNDRVASDWEDHAIEKQNNVKQLTAEGAGVVKHQEVIGSVNVHRNLLMTLSESFDIPVTHLL